MINKKIFIICITLFICYGCYPSYPEKAVQRPVRRPASESHIPPHIKKRPVSQRTLPDRRAVVEENVTYCKISDISLLLDVYKAENLNEREKRYSPAILLVHGGAFKGGDKGDPQYRMFSEHLTKLGYVVFNVNYRLAPEYHYPAALEDLKMAVQWIKLQSDLYQIDPDRIGAIGHSAGAYYVAMLALANTGLKCAAIYYGIFDLPSFQNSVSHGKSQMISLLGKSYEESPALWKEASPINHVSNNVPSIYLFHGTADTAVPVEQSRNFYKKLKNTGADVKYLELEGAGHGWKPPSPFGQRSEPELFKFLEYHLQPS